MAALESLDYKTLVDQGMRPTDLPQMSTQEWADYRREQMVAMRMQGMNPSEALKVVDDMTVGMQMRGFQREAQKAFLYMQTGQMDEAAMALSMAYQYFPNGATVQFANFDDPQSGRPVLVARAFDEESGEPTGKPVIVTADRLNAMVENMSNPQAFRTWTKDNRQLQLDVAEHKETVAHHGTMEDIYAYGAETDRMNAETRRLYPSGYGGDSDGIKPSEQRMRSELFGEQMKNMMMSEGYGELFEDPRVRQGMVNVLDALQMRYQNASPGNLVELVMRAFDGGMQQGGNVESALRAVEGLLAVPETG